MTEKDKEYRLTLSIAPTAQGFGYAVFEGFKELVEWSTSSLEQADKHGSQINKVKKLIAFYKPQVIVINDPKGSRRSKRVTSLLRAIEKLARHKKIDCYKYTNDQIKEIFYSFETYTKYEIAKLLTVWFEPLKTTLPPRRKPWMSTDYRMGIFDAVALAISHFYIEY